MTHVYADTMFTQSVKAEQEAYGSLQNNEKLRTDFGPNDALGKREIDFISKRDSFYLATVSETYWPYVQHRGGPRGFLAVVNPRQLAYADFRGNTQLISVGNLRRNGRCSLILMDYAHRRRLKLLGHIRVLDIKEVPQSTLALLDMPEYRADVERVFIIDLVAFDWNRPQHITRRYSADELNELMPLLNFIEHARE